MQERWIIALLATHVLLLLTVLLSRKNSGVQGVVFVTMSEWGRQCSAGGRTVHSSQDLQVESHQFPTCAHRVAASAHFNGNEGNTDGNAAAH